MTPSSWRQAGRSSGSLKEQLKIGGRLVIPVGTDQARRNLCGSPGCRRRIRSEDIADVRFVPLIGEEGWAGAKGDEPRAGAPAMQPAVAVEEALVRNLASRESFHRSKRPISILCSSGSATPASC